MPILELFSFPVRLSINSQVHKMSVRLTRAAFRSAALRNLQTSSALRVSRRMTSTSSHGSTHSSSDKPWIVSFVLFENSFQHSEIPSVWQIGSLLIFGPAVSFEVQP